MEAGGVREGVREVAGVGSTLEELKPWAGRMARTFLGADLHGGTAMDWEDLQQEAMIAVWQAEQAFDETRSPEKIPFVKWKARNHAIDQLRPRVKHKAYYGVEDADDVLDAMFDQDPSVLDRVIAAYHAGEIQEALKTLTPKQREYVELRFWGGLSEAELTAHFGYGPSGLWGAPAGRGGARRKLAVALAHLVED